jgi:hypothetical protein
MDERKYLTAEEVSERYRASVSVGTPPTWRAMKIGPPFIKIGKAVLYPIDQLEAWDKKNLVACRTSKQLSVDSREGRDRQSVSLQNSTQLLLPAEIGCCHSMVHNLRATDTGG